MFEVPSRRQPHVYYYVNIHPKESFHRVTKVKNNSHVSKLAKKSKSFLGNKISRFQNRNQHNRVTALTALQQPLECKKNPIFYHFMIRNSCSILLRR